MRDVGAELAGCGEADERVQVRAVDVHLAAVLVHDGAEAADARLEHAVRRRIRDHDRGEVRPVRARLGLEIRHVDIAVGIARDHDDAHARHLRRRRVGAVRGRRNEADVPMPFAAARMVRLDDEEPGVFTLRAGVGLQRHGGVTGRGAEHPLEVRDDFAVAFRLIGRREGMQIAELRPRDRNHLGRRVQLHRARAQRNHRAVEGNVAIGEAAEIAQHLRFGVIAVERRVREEWRRPPQRVRQRILDIGEERVRRAAVAERLPDRFDVGARRGLVERQAQRAVVDAAEIHPPRDAAFGYPRGGPARRDDDRVEKVHGRHRAPERFESRLQDRSQPMHAPSDRGEPRGAVVDGVHARDHREQDLRRADVRRRLLPADVLLARLQREAVRRPAVRVDGHADQATRHRALVLVARCEVAGMRSAVAHRHAETLRRADDDVGAPFARRAEERQREEIGSDHHVSSRGVDRRRERAIVAHVAIRAGKLEQHRESSGGGGVHRRAGHDLDPERRRARAHHVDRLREHVVGYEEAVAFAAPDAAAQRHRLGGGGGLVQHRRVGDGHPREVAHHRLEIDERLEAPLGNLGLVRRVRGVPGRALQDVAQDHSGRVRAVVALADERFQHLVLRRDRPDPRERIGLRHRRGQRERRAAPDRVRHDRIHQRDA